jgi:hypothetical protein
VRRGEAEEDSAEWLKVDEIWSSMRIKPLRCTKASVTTTANTQSTA